MSEGCRKALKDIKDQAAVNASSIEDDLSSMEGGEGTKVSATLKELYNRSDITLNFSAGMLLPDGSTMIDNLLNDPSLKNLHQTKEGGGSTDETTRSGWENANFHVMCEELRDDMESPYYGRTKEWFEGRGISLLSADDLPKYGALNVAHEEGGAATSYGSSHFVLNKEYLKDRITYTPGNSSGTQDHHVATHDHPLPALAESQVTLEQLPHDQHEEVESAVPRVFESNYLEAQIWGPLPLNSKTVKKLRVDGKKAFIKQYLPKLKELADKIGVPMEVY